MDPTPPNNKAFTEGLRLDHLNPRDIEQFLQSMPRRIDEGLSGLHENAPVDQLVELLHSIGDLLDELIDDVRAAGFPLNPNLEVSLPAWSDHANPSVSLAAARRRLHSGVVEATRRLPGISSEDWSVKTDLLTAARSWVGRAAASLREIDDVVETESINSSDPHEQTRKDGTP